MKKITAIVLVLLLTFSLFGCNRSDNEIAESIVDKDSVAENKGEAAVDSSYSDAVDVPTDSGGSTSDAVDVPTGSGGSMSYSDEKSDSSSADTSVGGGDYFEESDSIVSTGDSVISGAVTNDNAFIPDSEGKEDTEIIVEEIYPQQAQSGTLTAGEWKDLENLNFWSEILKRDGWKDIVYKRNLYTDKVVTVQVMDSEDNPCFNADVTLLDEQNNVIYSAVTDVTGYAYLFYNLNMQDKDKPAFVSVGNEKKVEISKNEVTSVTLDRKGADIKNLDLMLMVDTTGSMDDELSYLKEELYNVISEVNKTNQILSINLSVNFYRDEGDEYVVREFAFTQDITKATKHLSEQYANGGGDYPEAVHKALDSVVYNHKWRDDSVKLCFFVLDAPPHTKGEVQNIDEDMQKCVCEMAKQGIRFIPVASSGVDTETEFLCRSWAIMTGGTYTFLTDHSGVGGSHLEPTIGDYEVEKLNALMIRLIKEYCNIK